MASSGLRTFSGFTVGLVGGLLTIHISLAAAAALFIAAMGALLLGRRRWSQQA